MKDRDYNNLNKFSQYISRFCIIMVISLLCMGMQYEPAGVEEQINEYIALYQDVAIQESETSGIPVSIKLAQAIVESKYGTSGLAIEGRNHFGIKCKVDWMGEKVLADDDSPNECFRKYNTVLESYEDHSNFLKNHRLGFYDHLFSIDKRDYKAWAIGLQNAGYATTDHYAQSLVFLIEKYELYLFDKSEEGWKDPNFDYASLKKRKHTPTPKKEVASNTRVHTVRKGETMEVIAKRYNIPLEQLYSYNKLIWGSQPAEGVALFLNKHAYQAPKLKTVDYGRYIYRGSSDKLTLSPDK